MIDVLVTSFDPKNVVELGPLRVLPTSAGVHLAVESEIGGKSASSAYGVMKNVVEDYLKLLIVQAEHRVMIFTSLPYAGENEHVLNRVEVLRDLYSRASGVTTGMLLFHLAGSQPHSTQVQVSVATGTIRGFVISPDGCVAEELVAEELPIEGSLT
ncbi:hypothetical protein [Archangium sp. Cb G35]|uniref:hypothetical protein n=1 Tax=Archangium sp. Cb G35 TaxID=1920190 RepID=UPI0011612F92|nr:hypothetical protein [Archangium sp. Cb G35]